MEIQRVSEKLSCWSWEGSWKKTTQSVLYNSLYRGAALCGRASSLRGRGGTVGDFSLQFLHFLLQLSPLGKKLLVAIVDRFLQGNTGLSAGREAWKWESESHSGTFGVLLLYPTHVAAVTVAKQNLVCILKDGSYRALISGISGGRWPWHLSQAITSELWGEEQYKFFWVFSHRSGC